MEPENITKDWQELSEVWEILIQQEEESRNRLQRLLLERQRVQERLRAALKRAREAKGGQGQEVEVRLHHSETELLRALERGDPQVQIQLEDRHGAANRQGGGPASDAQGAARGEQGAQEEGGEESKRRRLASPIDPFSNDPCRLQQWLEDVWEHNNSAQRQQEEPQQDEREEERPEDAIWNAPTNATSFTATDGGGHARVAHHGFERLVQGDDISLSQACSELHLGERGAAAGGDGGGQDGGGEGGEESEGEQSFEIIPPLSEEEEDWRSLQRNYGCTDLQEGQEAPGPEGEAHSSQGGGRGGEDRQQGGAEAERPAHGTGDSCPGPPQEQLCESAEELEPSISAQTEADAQSALGQLIGSGGGLQAEARLLLGPQGEGEGPQVAGGEGPGEEGSPAAVLAPSSPTSSEARWRAAPSNGSSWVESLPAERDDDLMDFFVTEKVVIPGARRPRRSGVPPVEIEPQEVVPYSLLALHESRVEVQDLDRAEIKWDIDPKGGQPILKGDVSEKKSTPNWPKSFTPKASKGLHPEEVLHFRGTLPDGSPGRRPENVARIEAFSKKPGYMRPDRQHTPPRPEEVPRDWPVPDNYNWKTDPLKIKKALQAWRRGGGFVDANRVATSFKADGMVTVRPSLGYAYDQRQDLQELAQHFPPEEPIAFVDTPFVRFNAYRGIGEPLAVFKRQFRGSCPILRQTDGEFTLEDLEETGRWKWQHLFPKWDLHISYADCTVRLLRRGSPPFSSAYYMKGRGPLGLKAVQVRLISEHVVRVIRKDHEDAALLARWKRRLTGYPQTDDTPEMILPFVRKFGTGNGSLGVSKPGCTRMQLDKEDGKYFRVGGRVVYLQEINDSHCFPRWFPAGFVLPENDGETNHYLLPTQAGEPAKGVLKVIKGKKEARVVLDEDGIIKKAKDKTSESWQEYIRGLDNLEREADWGVLALPNGVVTTLPRLPFSQLVDALETGVLRVRQCHFLHNEKEAQGMLTKLNSGCLPSAALMFNSRPMEELERKWRMWVVAGLRRILAHGYTASAMDALKIPTRPEAEPYKGWDIWRSTSVTPYHLWTKARVGDMKDCLRDLSKAYYASGHGHLRRLGDLDVNVQTAHLSNLLCKAMSGKLTITQARLQAARPVPVTPEKPKVTYARVVKKRRAH